MASSNPTDRIVNAMRAMRSGEITADEYRATMRDLRESMTPEAFNAAKFAAVARDSR